MRMRSPTREAFSRDPRVAISDRFLPVAKGHNALSGAFHGMLHLKNFTLGRTEGLAVVAGLVETANLLLAGCKHIASITNSFCARLELLG